MKNVTITFDYEGSWGMPFAAQYDLAATTQQLLRVLADNHAVAVFFVTGKLIEQHPDIIRSIHEHGHEIGFHGYTHEHMHELTEPELAQLRRNLAQTGQALSSITEYTPKGFRAPYLMGPTFYDAAVYQTLADRGFAWISNREIRIPEELFRPDRLKMGIGLLSITWLRQIMLVGLNANLITSERHFGGRRVLSALRWLLGERSPFMRPEGLREFPLTSPLDCDLVGFPHPMSDSTPAFIEYATRVIKDCYDLSGTYFNINSHDWITGTSNRIQILDAILKHINATSGAKYYRPGLDGDAR